MKTVEVAEATNPLADDVPGVRTEPLVITDHGTPTAVMLPLDDVDLESLAVGTNPTYLALIERSRARAGDEGDVSADETRRRILGGP
jgi:antitoxin (DNA-binding transcriptional repressor) of toxin-antitoxin stability system